MGIGMIQIIIHASIRHVYGSVTIERQYDNVRDT